MSDDVRTILQQADQERAVARGVDMIQVSYRLGQPLAVKRGLFGRRARPPEPGWRELTGAESLALYRAAGIVKRVAEAKAAELEASVEVTPKGDDRKRGA